MLEEKVVANIMWTVRLMRARGDELSVQSVYEKQKYVWLHSYDVVTLAVDEVLKKMNWTTQKKG